MRRLNAYPKWFYALLMLCSFVVLFSGLLMLPDVAVMRLQWELDWDWSGDWRQMSVMWHSAAAFLLLMIGGALGAIHVRAGLRRRRNVRSGIVLLVLFAVLTVTALLIFYAADETLSVSASVIHCVAALISLPFFVWHQLRGAKLRLQRH